MYSGPVEIRQLPLAGAPAVGRVRSHCATCAGLFLEPTRASPIAASGSGNYPGRRGHRREVSPRDATTALRAWIDADWPWRGGAVLIRAGEGVRASTE